MTREEFVEWLQAYGCTPEPIEGINVTGWSVKYHNPKTGRYQYVHTPIDDTEMPDYVICHACQNLGIPTPDCVSHEEKRYNDIKQKFPGKR